MMDSDKETPGFDEQFPDLNQFILKLVDLYNAGRLTSWDDLESLVKTFFTSARVEQMDSRIPGWCKMASYAEGITLVHVMCVFLGMYMMPEFQSLTKQQQNIMKWTVLFHDLAKSHIKGKRDAMHAFNSGVLAAKTLCGLGFPATENFPQWINTWSANTSQAFVAPNGNAPIPDNRKLPKILSGVEELYGKNTIAAFIIKTVLLHQSLSVNPLYPAHAPLTKHEIKQYITPSLFPLLRVMMMSDNEGWSLFDPETRVRQRNDTLAAFEKVKELIS